MFEYIMGLDEDSRRAGYALSGYDPNSKQHPKAVLLRDMPVYDAAHDDFDPEQFQNMTAFLRTLFGHHHSKGELDLLVQDALTANFLRTMPEFDERYGSESDRVLMRMVLKVRTHHTLTHTHNTHTGSRCK
jgi:hypothetical protein